MILEFIVVKFVRFKLYFIRSLSDHKYIIFTRCFIFSEDLIPTKAKIKL